MALPKLRNTELRQAFQAMSSEDLASWKSLSDFIFHKVGIQLNLRSLDFKVDQDCWGGLQCKQYPDELGKLLAWIYQRKNKINSYCEIGLGKAGTFCVIDSFLKAINPNMGKTLGVNDCDVGRYVFNYLKENPSTETIIGDSLDFKPTQNYDLCLVDGDHRYAGVSHDFENMKNHSKYIILHDIDLIQPGRCEVAKLWDELKSKYPQTWEFRNENKNFRTPVGIGVVPIQ